MMAIPFWPLRQSRCIFTGEVRWFDLVSSGYQSIHISSKVTKHARYSFILCLNSVKHLGEAILPLCLKSKISCLIWSITSISGLSILDRELLTCTCKFLFRYRRNREKLITYWTVVVFHYSEFVDSVKPFIIDD